MVLINPVSLADTLEPLLVERDHLFPLRPDPLHGLQAHTQEMKEMFSAVATHNAPASHAAQQATLGVFHIWQDAVGRLSTMYEHRKTTPDTELQWRMGQYIGLDTEAIDNVKGLEDEISRLRQILVENLNTLKTLFRNHPNPVDDAVFANELADLQSKGRWKLPPILLLGMGVYLVSHLLPSPTDTAMTGAAGV